MNSEGKTYEGQSGAYGPTIMAVNLYHGGHHPQHLECLLAYWGEHFAGGEFHIVVSDAYREEHPALLHTADATMGAHGHLVPAPAQRLHRRHGLFFSDRFHGRVVSDWATRLGADHILLMYFDHVQLSLAHDLRFDRPLSISGIYFRPTFHYRELGVEQDIKERAVAARKKLVLRAALRNPHLRYVFCFDHLAVEGFSRFRSRVRALPLPEPLHVPSSRMERQSSLLRRIEPGRRRLLLFGSLDERKGIRPVLDALANLCETDQSRLALVLAGRVVGSDRNVLLERIENFRSISKVQVVLDDRYLDETEIQPLVRACDLVLLTYVHHVGSSGVLVRAAKAGVPVLSADYGLLGVQVRQNCLGATVDVASTPAISATLERWLTDPTSIGFDAPKARVFAAANTADAFSETIFSRLLPRPDLSLRSRETAPPEATERKRT